MSVQELQFKELRTVSLWEDKASSPGSTALSAAAAAAATSLTVSAITNFSDGDLIRIGSGETLEINKVSGAPSGSTINLARALMKDHAIGEDVVEQTAEKYGPPEGASCVVNITREASEVFTADQRLLYTILNGYGAARVAMTFPQLTVYNLALALGIPSSGISGTGASALNRKGFSTKGNDFGTLNNCSLVLDGKLNDGTDMRCELYGIAMDYAGVAMQLARGTLAGVPINALAGGGVMWTTAAAIATPSATYAGTAADVLDSLADVGVFADASPSTTANGAIAEGATTFDVADATGLANGDYLRIDSASNIEFVVIKSISTNTITPSQPILTAHATGVAVVKQSLTSFANIDQSGVQLNFGGTTSEIRNAFRDMAVGIRSGGASASLTVQLQEFILANFARSLGLAAPGGATLTVFTGLGTVSMNGIYVRGLLQSGQTFFSHYWYVKADVSSWQATLSNQGDAPTLPLVGRPLAGMQFTVYTA